MKVDSIYFSNYRCFGYPDKPAGFSSVKPINLIIGKNNSGKSHLLQLVKWMCDGDILAQHPKDEMIERVDFKLKGCFDKQSVQKEFPPPNDRDLYRDWDNPWDRYGNLLVNKPVTWYIENANKLGYVFFSDEELEPDNEYKKCIEKILLSASYPLKGTQYRHLAAERDIRPESEDNILKLSSSGAGATNIIRKFLLSSDEKYPREIITDTLLAALNEICGNDMIFTEIYTQKHDNGGVFQDCWEIYLGEKEKKLIALSQSGSGLKTILLTLLNLLVVPIIEEKSDRYFTFAFEELENNMHPALLRKLLSYIEKFALENEIPVFLTSHSATMLDFFATEEHAQIIYVKHDGKFAYTEEVSSYISCKEIINNLGAKASDLLQTNGIIWVEGPSDRIIVNQWIKLFSNGAYEEGRHYQCVFYGGGLLSNLGIASTLNNDQALEDPFVNLLAINSNAFIICDSDRRSVGAELKKRVKRIREEASVLDVPVWILKAREIENYYPGEALQQAYRKEKMLPDPERFESFFKTSREKGPSYSEKHLSNKSLHHYKTDLANRVTPYLTREMMEKRFDWLEQMPKLIECIKHWNL